MGLINAIFGTYSERQIKKIKRIANRVEALADEYKAKTNDERIPSGKNHWHALYFHRQSRKKQSLSGNSRRMLPHGLSQSKLFNKREKIWLCHPVWRRKSASPDALWLGQKQKRLHLIRKENLKKSKTSNNIKIS